MRTEKKLRPVRDLNPEVMGGHGRSWEVMGGHGRSWLQIPYGPESFSGLIFTTSSVAFITSRIAFIFFTLKYFLFIGCLK